LKLEGQNTIAACERQLRNLASAPPGEPLKIPTKMRYLAAGGEASVAQLIVSWAQKVGTPYLQTYISDSSDDQLAEFPRRFYGLIAALCADTIGGTPATVDVTEPLKKAAIQRLTELMGSNPKEAYRGPTAEIVCADHLGRESPYLLYQSLPEGGHRLRSRENFRLLADWLFRHTMPIEYQQAINPIASQAIGGMLFELIKNTEDHALVNAAGNLLDISIRALKTSHSSITPSDLARIVADFEPLATYCTSLRAPAGSAQTHLFELSILDSGPGFAPSLTGKSLTELSIEEEEQAVRHCFSRSTSKNHDRFGQGLPHVLRLLRQERGFLRLRTGRLSFYVDFSLPDIAEEGPDALRTWRSDDLAPVGGSLLTILIPMIRRS